MHNSASKGKAMDLPGVDFLCRERRCNSGTQAIRGKETRGEVEQGVTKRYSAAFGEQRCLANGKTSTAQPEIYSVMF